MRDQTDYDLHTAVEKLSVETKKLEEIASLPLPDISEFYDSSRTDTGEISDNKSVWALNMPHFLGDKDVEDIRSLKPDPFREDADADRASLYWYVKSKRNLNPSCELIEDPIFNSMVDRVVFGFSLQSKLRQRKYAAEVADLADKMYRVIKATQTLKRRQFLKKVNDAAVVIQRFWLGRKAPNAKISGPSDVAACNITQKKRTTMKTQGTSTEQQTDQVTVEEDYVRTRCKRDNTPEKSPRTDKFNERSEWFVDGLLRKINNAKGNLSLHASLENNMTFVEKIMCSCRSVRLAYTPLLEELEKLGRVYDETNGPMTLMKLVDKINKQNNEPLTPLSFCKSVSSISAALSEDLVERMGGFETIMQSSMTVIHYFSSSKPKKPHQQSNLILQSVQDFLQNMKRADSHIAATYLGVLLDKIGAKRNITGHAMVDDFLKSHSNNSNLTGPLSDVPKTSFLKWISSSKPKLDAGDMEVFQSEISSCDVDYDHHSSISMSKFLELCFPALSTKRSSVELQREIGMFLSGEFGTNALDRILMACREADVKKSGLVSWKEFFMALDNSPMMLTVGETCHLARLLIEPSITSIQVNYIKLERIVDGELFRQPSLF